MAQIALSFDGPADGDPAASLTYVGSVPDDQAQYFFSSYRAIYGPKTEAVTDKENNIITPAVEYTDAEIFQKYAQGISDGTWSNVQRSIEEQAKVAAVAATPKIAVVTVQAAPAVKIA